MKVNMAQIGEAAGVSSATVSNALNHRPGVNPETAAHVFHVARELGYFSDRPLSAIRLIHLEQGYFDVREEPFFAALLQGIESECRAQEVDALFSAVPASEESLPDKLCSDPRCGVILLATESSDEEIARFDGVRAPVLLLDNCPRNPAHSAVLIDNEGGVFQAIEHLLEYGHRRIGYLRYAARFRNFAAREAAYRQAMAEAGLTVNPDDVVTLTLPPDHARETMRGYLSGAASLPTAFFADNDALAFPAMQAMADCGIRVPEDVSIVGFDNILYARLSAPPLTTIHVDKQELGRLAVRILLEQSRCRSSAPTKTQICTRLVQRESVRHIT